MTTQDSPGNENLSVRQKLILAGLYFSKFDSLGLRELGFESFLEAFNVIGYALGSKPASVKNYRDEFDPLFPNSRKGWHKRPTRVYCRDVLDQYNHLAFEDFSGLVRSLFGLDSQELNAESQTDGTTAFARRLVTGLAAEHYFESVHPSVPIFRDLLLENTTRFGCGYDFRLRPEPDHKDFLAVEVKGLMDESGTLTMTPKEYDTAAALRDRFFLFVVKNFRETPSHTIFQDPTSSGLLFKRTERVIVQTSWQTAIS